MRRWTGFRGLLALGLLFAAPALAIEGYEERIVEWGLAKAGRELEPSPEGKQIEEILVVSENVFAPSDPYPLWFNTPHVQTKERVVRRELLFAKGEPYSVDKIEETERNLRGLYILAVVKVVAVKGRQGGVAVLVVTKDRWSLRLNSEYNLVGTLLQYLRLRPTEMNFLGLNQQLALDFILRLDSFSLGQYYQAPRLLGSKLTFGETASVIFNRATGEAEGSTGAAVFGKPLLNLSDPWAYSVGASWSVRPRRIYRGAEIWQLDFPDSTNAQSQVPYVYLARSANWDATLVRSLGYGFKTDLSLGIGGYTRQYTVPLASRLSQEEADWFLGNYVPRSEDATFLTARVYAYLPRYQVLKNIHSFELSEDFQLGPLASLSARWAPSWLASPTQYVELAANARYRALWGGDLATFSIAGTSRWSSGETKWVNQRVAAEISNVTPPFVLGRLVTRALVDLVQQDLEHRQLLLGGGNGLRGADPESLAGRHQALFNVELRTPALEFKTLFFGLVFFYDAGTAFDTAPSFTHTLGLGLRLLIPQFNQETIRVDVGWVLGEPSPFTADRFSSSFGQVTDYRASFLDQPMY